MLLELTPILSTSLPNLTNDLLEMNINVQSYLVIDVLFSAGYFLKCSTDLMMKFVKMSL